MRIMLSEAIKGGIWKTTFIYDVVFEGMLNKWQKGRQLRNVNKSLVA